MNNVKNISINQGSHVIGCAREGVYDAWRQILSIQAIAWQVNPLKLLHRDALPRERVNVKFHDESGKSFQGTMTVEWINIENTNNLFRGAIPDFC
jgi:hypothetical protein